MNQWVIFDFYWLCKLVNINQLIIIDLYWLKSMIDFHWLESSGCTSFPHYIAGGSFVYDKNMAVRSAINSKHIHTCR